MANKPKKEEVGSLSEGQPHPMAYSALDWFNNYKTQHLKEWMMMQESIASSALAGNDTAEVLHETIRRLNAGEPVSDRYLFGLCWFLRDSEEPCNKGRKT